MLVAAAAVAAFCSPLSWALSVLVFALGAFVGFVEVLVRFRDEPFQAVSSTPGIAYFSINGVAATAIYSLIVYLKVTFGAPPDSPLTHVLQVTIAAFSGIAFLRSGFFVGKDKNTGENMMYGPALVLESILAVVSTQVDRDRAYSRIKLAEAKASTISLVQAQGMLGVLVASVQTMPAEQTTGINAAAAGIGSNATLEEKTKVKMLLLLYLTHFGEKAVDAATPAQSTQKP